MSTKQIAVMLMVLTFVYNVNGLKCKELTEEEEDSEFEKIAETSKALWEKIERKETQKRGASYKPKTKEVRKALFKKRAKEAREANKKKPKFCQEPNEMDALSDYELGKYYHGIQPEDIPPEIQEELKKDQEQMEKNKTPTPEEKSKKNQTPTPAPKEKSKKSKTPTPELK